MAKNTSKKSRAAKGDGGGLRGKVRTSTGAKAMAGKAMSQTPSKPKIIKVERPATDRAKRAAAEAHRGDPDNMPITQADIDAGTLKLVKRRGRPVGTGAGKVRTTIRLDPDVLEALRADGPGWQTRANAHLRAALNLDDPRAARSAKSEGA